MSKIVADGRERYLEANQDDVEIRREELEVAVLKRYRDDLSKAGFWRRLVLRVKMRREVRAERLTGDEYLYWTAPS